MNPSFREPGVASETPPDFGAEPAAPPPAAVDEDDQSVEPAMEPDVPPGPETDSEGRPLPVHIPYARTSSDPHVVVAQPARSAPRPSRSPFWAAVRSHVWLVVIVLVLIGIAGAAYWGLRVHQRIEGGTLERAIAGREGASTVRCVEQQPNGAVWACGLVYRAASVCLIANVNPVGDWTTKAGVDLCDHRAELNAILPARVTAGAVSADLASQLGIPDTKCVKVPGTKVRWACLGRSSAGGNCWRVRVAPWRSLTAPQMDVCSHLPQFKKHRKKA